MYIVLYTYRVVSPLQHLCGSLTAITRMVHIHFDSEPVDAVVRLPSATELHCLQGFHAHVSTCSVCRRSLTPVVRYHLLCEEGRKTATAVCEVLVARKGKICAVNATRLPYDVVVEVPQTFWTARALLQDYFGTLYKRRSNTVPHRQQWHDDTRAPISVQPWPRAHESWQPELRSEPHAQTKSRSQCPASDFSARSAWGSRNCPSLEASAVRHWQDCDRRPRQITHQSESVSYTETTRHVRRSNTAVSEYAERFSTFQTTFTCEGQRSYFDAHTRNRSRVYMREFDRGHTSRSATRPQFNHNTL